MIYNTRTSPDTSNAPTITLDYWMPISELSSLHRVGISRLREVLCYLHIFEAEDGRYRLTQSAIDEGLGRRFNRRDVTDGELILISPLGQKLVEENWEWVVQSLKRKRKKATRLLTQIVMAREQFKAKSGGSLDPDQEVSWLLRHLTQLKLEQLAILFESADGCADWTHILTGSSASQ